MPASGGFYVCVCQGEYNEIIKMQRKIVQA